MLCRRCQTFRGALRTCTKHAPIQCASRSYCTTVFIMPFGGIIHSSALKQTRTAIHFVRAPCCPLEPYFLPLPANFFDLATGVTVPHSISAMAIEVSYAQPAGRISLQIETSSTILLSSKRPRSREHYEPKVTDFIAPGLSAGLVQRPRDRRRT